MKIKKVYVLTDYCFDDYDFIIGVFRDKEKAVEELYNYACENYPEDMTHISAYDFKCWFMENNGIDIEIPSVEYPNNTFKTLCINEVSIK